MPNANQPSPSYSLAVFFLYTFAALLALFKTLDVLRVLYTVTLYGPPRRSRSVRVPKNDFFTAVVIFLYLPMFTMVSLCYIITVTEFVRKYIADGREDNNNNNNNNNTSAPTQGSGEDVGEIKEQLEDIQAGLIALLQRVEANEVRLAANADVLDDVKLLLLGIKGETGYVASHFTSTDKPSELPANGEEEEEDERLGKEQFVAGSNVPLHMADERVRPRIPELGGNSGSVGGIGGRAGGYSVSMSPVQEGAGEISELSTCAGEGEGKGDSTIGWLLDDSPPHVHGHRHMGTERNISIDSIDGSADVGDESSMGMGGLLQLDSSDVYEDEKALLG